MHGKTFISDLKEGSFVETFFLVKHKSLQYAKNGSTYLNVILCDKSGEIAAKIWENANEINKDFNNDDFVYAKGRVNKYMDKMQLIISEIKSIQEDLINLEDFQKATTSNIDKMKKDLSQLISEIKSPYLNELLKIIFSDSNLLGKYSISPAAKAVHHAYIGGLLEHSLKLAKLANAISPFYKEINFDLVKTAILLHDIGKVRELKYKRSFDYTTEGKLIGHIVIGTEMLNNYIEQIKNFPEDLRIQLLHIILSHHGSLEFGSPKRPKTLEAIIVSYLDDLDSKIQGIMDFAKEDPSLENSPWTSYHKFYERYFYLPQFSKKNEKLQNSTNKRSNKPLSDKSIAQELQKKLLEKENSNQIEKHEDQDQGVIEF